MISLVLACAAPLGVLDTTVVAEVVDSATAVEAFVGAIEGAQTTVSVALAGDEPEVRAALEAAADAGVDVDVVVDIDLAGAFSTSGETHGYAVALLDPGFGFFDFGINLDVAWAGDQVVQSNNWVLVDDAVWWVSSSIGTGLAGDVVLASLTGEEVLEDAAGEHNQLSGGVDATSVDAYNGLNKSITDLRYRYPTDSGEVLHFGFGPQERLVKQVVDAVYRSRGRVVLLTADITDVGLTAALGEKADAGFEVNVVTETLSAWTAPVSVAARQVDGVVPTVLWTDDGDGHSVVMVVSHPIWAAGRVVGGVPVTTDQLVDGLLWSLESSNGGPNLELLQSFVDATFARGVTP